MKTEKEIFDDYCDFSGIGPINSIYYRRLIMNTYGFMRYRLSVRWSEFINSLAKELKLDKLLNWLK